MPSTPTESLERMQCMEVWGGNSPVDRSFATAGLQIWLHSRPFAGAEGGGDVYYVSSCASGRITRLLLADVSGHGAEAASVAVALRDLMRQNVNLFSQRRFVREMNRQFSAQRSESGFATAIVCTFFAPTRSLQLCNAGHPSAMLYRAQQGKWSSARDLADVEHAKGLADTPLGVADGADYSRFDTKLAAGDMMLCVSDAFTESRDGDGSLLGTGGLLRIVQGVDVSRPEDILPKLISSLSRLRADNLREDDATAILVRADGSSVSLKDNLLAPFRLLRGVRDGV